jgi:hypothetical protein
MGLPDAWAVLLAIYHCDFEKVPMTADFSFSEESIHKLLKIVVLAHYSCGTHCLKPWAKSWTANLLDLLRWTPEHRDGMDLVLIAWLLGHPDTLKIGFREQVCKLEIKARGLRGGTVSQLVFGGFKCSEEVLSWTVLGEF